MSKRKFSNAERYAVFTIHLEKCYLCGKAIDLLSMVVDHVIPETLLDDPPKLAVVLEQLGLPADFDLQSFANWMPTCGPCNLRKREEVFEPSLLVQLCLQTARKKAPSAEQLAKKTVSNQAQSRAWNTIQRAAESGELNDQVRAAIDKFTTYHSLARQPEVTGRPLLLTPLLEVISERDGIRIVKGPHGYGGGPIGPNIHSSFRCPHCGNAAWYTDVLGLREVERPSNFVTPVRWFELGNEQIHLIPADEPDAISPRHFAIHVDDVQAARETLRERGVEVRETVPIAGADRFFISDPAGNNLELIQWFRQWDGLE